MTKVSVSRKISAAAPVVWGIVGDYGNLANWLPGIAACATDGEGVGAIRTLTLDDGVVVVERLDSHDDGTRTLIYTVTEGPFPMEDYVAKVVIIEGDDTSCTFSWSCSFEPHQGAEDELTKDLKDMLQQRYGPPRSARHLVQLTVNLRFSPIYQ